MERGVVVRERDTVNKLYYCHLLYIFIIIITFISLETMETYSMLNSDGDPTLNSSFSLKVYSNSTLLAVTLSPSSLSATVILASFYAYLGRGKGKLT